MKKKVTVYFLCLQDIVFSSGVRLLDFSRGTGYNRFQKANCFYLLDGVGSPGSYRAPTRRRKCRSLIALHFGAGRLLFCAASTSGTFFFAGVGVTRYTYLFDFAICQSSVFVHAAQLHANAKPVLSFWELCFYRGAG